MGYKSEEAWANAITVTLEWTEWAGDMAFSALAAFYLKGVGATAAGMIKAKMIEALNFYIYEPEKGWDVFSSRQLNSIMPLLMNMAKGRVLSIENIELVIRDNRPLAWTIFIAAIAIGGFYLYGAFSDEIDNPEALRIGLVIGAMFLLIGLMSAKSRNRASWDGVVIDKKVRRTDKQTIYTVYIKSETGKVHERRFEDDTTVFNYFKKGDKVRFHGKLNSYEKFDKSGDDIIFCNACAFLH